jgi:nucleoside-diphosphate-sugar epimerase
MTDRGVVLVTGGSGLIGGWTLAHWPADAPAPLTVRSDEVDLLALGAASDLVDRVRPSGVLHLAWSASGRPDYRSSPDNDRWPSASLELVDACRRHGARLWLTGTVVDDPEHAADAPDAYTRSKAELRARVAGAVEAGEIGWLRPAYVFDEGRGRPALVRQARTAAARDETLDLATPEAAHDFVHAEDVGRAVALAVAEGCTGYLPVGSGRLRRVADLVTALGARWQAATQARPPSASHAERAADIAWLTHRGWTPTRTREFFSDD